MNLMVMTTIWGFEPSRQFKPCCSV